MTTWKKLFISKFKPVYREINKLRNDIYDKEWFLFFSWHTNTLEELYKSPHHHKIDSFSRKIASDTKYWKDNNKISQIGLSEYQKHEKQVDKLLKSINYEIENRDETVWERVSSACIKYTRHIVNILNSPFVKPYLPPIVQHPLKILGDHLNNQYEQKEQSLLAARSSYDKYFTGFERLPIPKVIKTK